MLVLGPGLRICLGICWGCRKPSGKTKWENKVGEQEQETSPQRKMDLKQSTLSDFLD
jgi:hypothetical protein